MKKATASFLTLVKKSIKALKEKEQDILMSYFGIEDQRKTLEAIGKNYQITRERVRQIRNNAISKIQKGADSAYQKSLVEIEKFVKSSGGIIPEDLLCEKFVANDKKNQSAFIFSLYTNPNLTLAKETDCHRKLWVHNGKAAQLISPACVELEKILKKNKKPLKLSELISQFKISPFYKNNSKYFTNGLIKSLPFAAKNIIKTKKGEWGLSVWPEINPKNTRDKIYYILTEDGKPLHFRDLTKRIAAGNFQGKNPASATVHNELIADKRFVLIGKGIYALSSWGYKPGTVADVLRDILSQVKKGLTQEELISEVLKVRQISKNTVIMNLRSQKVFARNEESNLWKLAK